MFADVLATAAFVMGPADGLRLLERMNVEGLLVTPSLDLDETADSADDLDDDCSAVFRDAEGTPNDHPGFVRRADRSRTRHRLVAPGLVASIRAAGGLDAAILRWRRKSWWFPSGAASVRPGFGARNRW